MSDPRHQLQADLAERYVLERELGRGGMATVYLARDLKHDRSVALKALHPELAATLGPERFLREIHLTARLDHPHILPVFDSGEAAGQLWYTMPYVEGESLRDRLRREVQLPIEDAMRIAREVGEALDYAHRHGIVHRDIKPENVMLGEGHARVADFGVARALETAGGSSLTETGFSVGTPAYMSPEQASGGLVDGRSDIYALGCVVYEMLAGEPPYTGPTAQAILAKRLSDPVPSVRRLREEVPEQLDAFLHRALAKASADRFASAARFAEALAGTERETAGHEYGSGTRTRATTRSPNSARLRRPALLGFLALVLLAGSWVLLRPHPATAPVSPNSFAVLPFQVAGPGLEPWREGLVDLLSIDLDGVAGLRAIHPRTVLGRWNRALGDRGDTADQRATLQVARDVGAQYALMGSLVGTTRRVRLDGELYDLRKGELRGRAEVEGSPDSLPALVDHLSIELVRQGVVGEQGAVPRVALSRLTTTSLPALKAYLDGENKFRHARPAEAIADFTRAVEADSSFALAWFRLAAADGWTRSPHHPEPSRYDSAAVRFANRLPKRDRLLLKANAELDEGRLEAIHSLERLITLYPDDAEAWYLLGDAYYHLGPFGAFPQESFRNALHRSLELDPSFAPAYLHLTEDAFVRQDSAAAAALIARLRRIDPASPKVTGLALAYTLVWGDSGARQAVEITLDTASTLALLTAKHAINFAPDFPTQTLRIAQAIVSQDRHPVDDRTSAQFGIAIAHFHRGHVRQAEAALDSVARMASAADPLAPVWAARQPLFWYLLGSPDTVGISRAIKELVPSGPRRPAGPEVAYYSKVHFLRGALAASEGRKSDVERELRALADTIRVARAAGDSIGVTYAGAARSAIRGMAAGRKGELVAGQRYLETSEQGFRGLSADVAEAEVYILRTELSRILLVRGRSSDAVRYLEPLDHRTWFYWLAAAPREFYLAEAFEAQGDTSRAKLHYGNFVRWWRDCDPELRPMWEQGRQALLRLTEERVRP